MRIHALVILVLLLFPVIVSSQEAVDAGAGGAAMTKFDPARDAANDIANAVAEAARSGRRVLLDVGGEWCVWCRRLDTLFATHGELRATRDASFVTVKVNWSKENKNEKVLSQYPAIKGYPHLFVLENDGTLLHSQDTGALEKGKGHDPEKVLTFLRQWAPGKTQ